MRKFALALCALTIATPAFAGTAGYGLPLNIIVTEGGPMLFDVPNNRQNPPLNGCATQATRFAIPSNTDWGKAMISMILSAQARGKMVFINGTGTCNAWFDSEGVDYVQVEN